MAKPRTELVLAYIGALELSAIKVMVGKTAETPSWLQLETEPELIETDGPLVMFDTLWFSKAAHADLVFGQCLTVIGGAPDAAIALPASEVRDAAINQAASLGAPWRTTQEIVATAENAIDEVERHVAALNQSGGLAPLNAGYKSYRIAMQTTGVPAVNYATYLLSFKLKMVKRVAENVAAGVDKFSGLASVLTVYPPRKERMMS